MELVKSKKLKDIECEILNYNATELLLRVSNNKTNKNFESIMFKTPKIDDDIDMELNRLIIKTM